MDVESQKMSEPEITSQTDTNNNQVCGCCVACFNALLHQIPDVCRAGVTVRGYLWRWQVLCLDSMTQKAAAPVCSPGCMNTERQVLYKDTHKRSLEFFRLKGFFILKRSGKLFYGPVCPV